MINGIWAGIWAAILSSFLIGILFGNIIWSWVYRDKKSKEYIDSNWDANKAREESEMGMKREAEKEINSLYNRIRIGAEVGNYYIYDIYISKLAIEYFKSKNYKITLPNGLFNYYKISWENNK